jgi:hypothetical protein
MMTQMNGIAWLKQGLAQADDEIRHCLFSQVTSLVSPEIAFRMPKWRILGP